MNTFEYLREKFPTIGANARDLIKELALDPSPVFSQLLSSIAEERLMGNLTTREEALEFARQMLAGKTDLLKGCKYCIFNELWHI